MKCIIIDDEPLAIEVLKMHLSKFDNVRLVASFTNPLQAFEIIEREKIDFLLIDINMPEINGLEFIKSLSYKPLVVITTAYKEYAVKGYELDVLDYLIKPVSFERFIRMMNKVMQRLYQEHHFRKNILIEPHIFIKSNKKLIKVNLTDILYVESLKDYVKVVTVTGSYLVYKSITAFTEELPESMFLRIHRSFSISLNKITAVNGNQVELNDKVLPIGRNYIKKAKQKIFNTP